MLSLPSPKSHRRVADWVELTVAATGAHVSQSFVVRTLEAATGAEVADSFLTDVWNDLQARNKLYHPRRFAIDDTVMSALEHPPSTVEYLTCLFLSLYGVQESTPTKLFERLTCHVIRRYLPAEGLVFGWPFAKKRGKKPSEETLLGRYIRDLALRTHETFVQYPSSRFKDRGVDVIGWVPFPEGRSGQIVVLLQCAAGHDWQKKLPVPIKAWKEYVHWACDPLIGFSVPCVIEDSIWHDSAAGKGILLDRPRIINCLSDGVPDKDLSEELESWVAGQKDTCNE